MVAQFTYDADGKRVKSVMGTETILFVGAHFEIKNGSEITKYYMAGSTRIAMRKYQIPQPMTVEYMLNDHLGSTSLTADVNGNKVLEIRYREASRAALWRVDKACPLRYTAGVLRKGEIRATWTSSPSTTPAYKMPLYTYTGQASYMDDPTTSGVTEGFGLMYYGARWFDPSLGRFVQADTVTPRGAQGLDKYAYANNSPVKYADPSGHMATECSSQDSCGSNDEVTAEMIETEFGIKISDPKNSLWTSQNLLLIYSTLYAFRKFVGNDVFSYLSGVSIAITGLSGGGSEFNRDTNTMEFNPQEAFSATPKTGLSASQTLQYTLVHEAAHALFYGLAGQNYNSENILSSKYGLATGWTSAVTKGGQGFKTTWDNPGNGPTAYARGELRDANGNLIPVDPAEDYAESVSVLIYPWIPNTGVTQDRSNWINDNIRGD